MSGKEMWRDMTPDEWDRGSRESRAIARDRTWASGYSAGRAAAIRYERGSLEARLLRQVHDRHQLGHKLGAWPNACALCEYARLSEAAHTESATDGSGDTEAVDAGLADVAAGRTKPWSEVRERLDRPGNRANLTPQATDPAGPLAAELGRLRAVEVAARKASRTIDWFLDRNIYRAYPFEDQARALRTALAAAPPTTIDSERLAVEPDPDGRDDPEFGHLVDSDIRPWLDE